MRIKITESQKQKLIKELSPDSVGVKEFIENVKETPGLLRHLGFHTHKSLEDFILDCDYNEFQELKKDAESFKPKKK